MENIIVPLIFTIAIPLVILALFLALSLWLISKITHRSLRDLFTDWESEKEKDLDRTPLAKVDKIFIIVIIFLFSFYGIMLVSYYYRGKNQIEKSKQAKLYYLIGIFSSGIIFCVLSALYSSAFEPEPPNLREVYKEHNIQPFEIPVYE